MNKEDKKLQKDLVNEMMKVSKTNPDVMIYMQSLMKFYEDLEKENQQLKKQKDDVVECCKNSIKSINEKLENNKEPFEVVDGKIIYLNDYQVVRLKAIRMKCKEILRMLGEIDE